MHQAILRLDYAFNAVAMVMVAVSSILFNL